MEKKIHHIDTVTAYEQLLGVESLHPQVGVIDLSQAHRLRHELHTFGFYTLFLKEVKCGELIYGRLHYDYQEGTVVCLAPGQVIGIEDNGQEFQPRGHALCFHPDFVHGTSLGSRLAEYSFFAYEVNEALHLSNEERETIMDCFGKIRHELQHPADRLSRRLLTANIELLLDYCLRFYERQFATRHVANCDILTRFEALLEHHFRTPEIAEQGLPTVRRCADLLCLSPNYLGDLLKRETGRTPQEHIQQKLVAVAKERLLDPRRSITQVAYELGFQYPQHLTRLFKKITGLTPAEYRAGSGKER